MLRRLSTTPCPVGDPQHHEGRCDSALSASNDTTADLDYTTEFKALFRNTKPRRRPTAIGKSNGVGLGFTIHEDEELKLDALRSRENGGRSSVKLPQRQSIMSRPAQRPNHRASFVQPQQNNESEFATLNLRPTFANAPRRVSTQARKSTVPLPVPEDETLPRIPSPKISKPARRGTIYIPSDDTTMPSMYMGIFSPLKSGAPEAKQEKTSDMTGLAAQIAKKRASRKSVLAASPKRAPLQSRTQPLQAPAVPEIRAGQGPGKENLPPGHAPAHQQITSKRARTSVLAEYQPPRRESTNQRSSSRLFEQTASSFSRSKDREKSSKPVNKQACNTGTGVSQAQPIILKLEGMPRRSLVPDQMPQKLEARHPPTRFVVPNVPAEPVLSEFPLLQEGVTDVSMYEESWLTQQEVAITQLVNNLFQGASPTFGEGDDYDLLRLKLLELYGSSDIALLFKRIQGALLYGALSISKDTLENGHRLSSDLGHRRAFVNLWLDTYDHHVLRTALEVIVGRLVGCKGDHVSGRGPPASPSTIHRRSLHRTIETFLVRNEDSNPDPQTADTAAWSFQRTLLRSLMLIKLLDMVKTIKGLPPTANLFRPGSVHKSSVSVVQRLMKLMNPCVGDPIRPLTHLGYGLSHCQYPLEEYDYEIRNLAVDLRDGVRLTRLVELLLYRSASQLLEHNHNAHTTTTLAMPAGETLQLTECLQDWPLSQHLKFPCLGRATKLSNAQIPLSALHSVKGMSAILQDISAGDIVDGYREKTVRLLWVLTSKWGLGGLVDWEDLKKEIKRLGRSQGKLGDWCINDLDFDEEDPGYMRYKTLLKEWVKGVASAHGLVVRNFTTSFADGRIFKAIVDEYQPYLVEVDGIDAKCSLSSRLKNLGCSEQFVRLFEKTPGHSNEHIFDRDFVLASLAFLCSRLLGPSKRVRAAVAIQRRWRARWNHVLEQRKSVLHILAASCAARVQDNQTRAKAKVTLWRSWKAYKARKQGAARNQSTFDAALAREVSRLSLADSSNDEEDIWLSLP